MRAEPGNVRFEPYVVDGTNEVRVVEAYVDDAAFAAHLADPTNSAFNDSVAEARLGGVALEFLTPYPPDGNHITSQ